MAERHGARYWEPGAGAESYLPLITGLSDYRPHPDSSHQCRLRYDGERIMNNKRRSCLTHGVHSGNSQGVELSDTPTLIIFSPVPSI